MSVKLKICGIRRTEDVSYLNEYLPDYAGFILSKPFWRYIPPEQIKVLVQELDRSIKRVGVFVNPDLTEIAEYAQYLDIIQLHGEENTDLIEQIRNQTGLEIWKAARVQSEDDIHHADSLPVDKLVLDSFSSVSHGGTGTLAPWDIIRKHHPQKPFLLAGGISAENALEAVEAVQPFGIDVSSSVETEKCKDPDKIRTLVSIIQK